MSNNHSHNTLSHEGVRPSLVRLSSELAARLSAELDLAHHQIARLSMQCSAYEAEIQRLKAASVTEEVS